MTGRGPRPKALYDFAVRRLIVEEIRCDSIKLRDGALREYIESLSDIKSANGKS